MPTFFMTSQTQTAKRKIAALMAVFLQLANVDFFHKAHRNKLTENCYQCTEFLDIYFDSIHVGRAHDTSSRQVSFKSVRIAVYQG